MVREQHIQVSRSLDLAVQFREPRVTRSRSIQCFLWAAAAGELVCGCEQGAMLLRSGRDDQSSGFRRVALSTLKFRRLFSARTLLLPLRKTVETSSMPTNLSQACLPPFNSLNLLYKLVPDLPAPKPTVPSLGAALPELVPANCKTKVAIPLSQYLIHMFLRFFAYCGVDISIQPPFST